MLGMNLGVWNRGQVIDPSWWVPKDARTLDLDFGAGAYWDSIDGAQGIADFATFDRNSAAGRFGPAGAYESIPADMLRRDYDPATLAARGALIEAAVAYERVNSLLSGAVAGSPGTMPTGVTAPAPAGLTRTLTIDTIDGVPRLGIRYVGAPSSDFQFILQTIPGLTVAATTGQTWTAGMWIAGSGTGLGQLGFGTWETDGANALLRSNDSPVTLPAAWARRSRTYTVGAGTVYQRFLVYTGVITAGTTCDFTIYIGGATLTQTAYLPSPNLVGTSAATRLADTLSLPFGSWGVQGEGTVLAEVEFVAGADVGNNVLVQLDAGNVDNRILLRRDASTNIVYARSVVGGGVAQCILNLGAAVSGRKRVAFAYATNDFRAVMTGGSVASDVSGSVPADMTTMWLGSNGIGSEYLNGWLRQVAYLPLAADNAALSAWVNA